MTSLKTLVTIRANLGGDEATVPFCTFDRCERMERSARPLRPSCSSMGGSGADFCHVDNSRILFGANGRLRRFFGTLDKREPPCKFTGLHPRTTHSAAAAVSRSCVVHCRLRSRSFHRLATAQLSARAVEYHLLTISSANPRLPQYHLLRYAGSC